MDRPDSSRDDIAAVLFCAGRGERLRPLTDTVAKPAVVVGDRPLAAYGMEVLQQIGGKVAVNLSWLHASTRRALEPYAPSDTEWLVELPAPLGTAGTVARLLPRLAPSFVVMNGDTIADLDVDDLMASHRRFGSAATLAVEAVSRGADFCVDGERATRMVLRKRVPDVAGARYIGVGVFERAALVPLLRDARPPLGLAEAVFGPLTASGRLAVHRHDGLALDVGTPEALAEARSLAEAGALPWR